MFEKILIANRGEIACRVIRTARQLGIRTVAVYSQADADAQHVRQADEAYPIGGAAPAESYLRGDTILAVASQTGAQAIHPGYGFLSENADFADAVAAAKLVFIGPPGASMRAMGSKAGAKELMQTVGVPVVPGYTGEDQSPDLMQDEADRIGYPLMIKAAHGGGGKGMRIVRSGAEFLSHLESCQREARNAFGRDRVLLERYIESPRHIEIQVFADTHGNIIHLNERECSAQRRYQKVLEESPSPFLTQELRATMGAAAVQAARAINYVNAGTVEFIVDPDGRFYFMEINTRLQVEHPVTELVTGLDLVQLQLQVAAGRPLPITQQQVRQNGHAIEVRLYAEDPDAGFLPGSGQLLRLRLPPQDAQLRIDSGVIEGDIVTIFYDPMIAKLIVHAHDRPAALARLRDALAQCWIEGPKSNIAFLERLARHPAVIEGRIDTSYLDRHLDEFIDGDADTAPQSSESDASGHDASKHAASNHAASKQNVPNLILLAAAATVQLLREEQTQQHQAQTSGDPSSPWALADGWRLSLAGTRRIDFVHHNRDLLLHARGNAGRYHIELQDPIHGGEVEVSGARLFDDRLEARFNGIGQRLRVYADASTLVLHDGRRRLQLQRVPAYRRVETGVQASGDRVLAPMPGRVVLVKTKTGDTVEAGQDVIVLEAMKMELTLKSPRAGVVAQLRVSGGEFVDADDVLLLLEPT